MICSTTQQNIWKALPHSVSFANEGEAHIELFYLPNKKENDRDYLTTKSFRALQNGEQWNAF